MAGKAGWGQTSQDLVCQAEEFMNNGRALTALVSNGEQTLRTDGINIGANT